MGKVFVVLLLILLAMLWATVHCVATTFTGSSTHVAFVSCSELEQHQMTVQLNGQSYEITGDRWELNASIVKIQPWLQFLGMSNGYSLNRLTGQFDDENA